MICTKMVLSALLRSTLCRLGTIAAIASMTSFRSRLSFARYSYWMPNWDSRRQHQSASTALAMRAFKTLRQAPNFQQTLTFPRGLKGPFVATVSQQRLLHCEQACGTPLSPERELPKEHRQEVSSSKVRTDEGDLCKFAPQPMAHTTECEKRRRVHEQAYRERRLLFPGR
jgi:hypothetical protein